MVNNLPTRLLFGQEIINLADEYDFIICNADTKTCGLEHFGDIYPDREVSFGIAEQNLIAGASGIATYGTKVIVSTYAVFATLRACEQVRTYVCQPNLNVMIIGTHGGLLTSTEGASHTAIEDISIMRAFPNITILEPSDGVSAKIMVKAALEWKGPLYIRLHFLPVPDVHNPKSYNFQIGKAKVIYEYGHDIVFFVSGILLAKVIDASKQLLNCGIKTTVVEFTTIKPLDKEIIIKYAKLTRGIITVEDHTILGGFGSAISEVVSEHCPTIVKRIGIQDQFGESGEPEELYKKHHMTVDDMIILAKKIMGSGRK